VHYPPGQGYDAADHIAYADGLVPGWRLPQEEGEYYTPPGFYFVAGVADWLAGKAGLGDPHRATLALNVLFLLGTMLLVRQIARELWPGRDRLALAAVAFVAFVPVTLKTAAMFHPETLSLFLSTLALWCCVRTFRDWRWAFALGAALGAAQLVRLPALWTVTAVAIALVLGRRWRALAAALAVAAVIPLPWYVHQTREYGSPFFPRPATEQARDESGEPKPIWQRRPLAFYVDPGLPDVITNPWRDNFLNRAVPTTYTEIWGDYFGIWAWTGRPPPPEEARGDLRLQAVIGLLPTLVAVAGWLALLLASLRSPPRLAIALLPGLGILAYLAFTVSYPTPDGDVLKGTYMLTTATGWAFGFAYAIHRLRGNWYTLALALLGLCALLQLPFLVY
jgi:4-amino-4-deoxy-L-arabinose transferase-like glycosyltransferase